MGALKRVLNRRLVGGLGINAHRGTINWFPGHMASAISAIRQRIKLADLVIEVRDSRIPLSSVNEDLQSQISAKRRVIALNKKDLANPNIIRKWIHYFDSLKQDCIPINAHSRSSVNKLLELVELRLKELIIREPTLLVIVVGVPNVGKSALINSIHQIAISRFPVQKKRKRATVGPLPGVTQDIAGYQIAHHPSIYVLDTPGVLVPSIPDIETGLKLALAGSIKDSVVGEDRVAWYLLAVLNSRGTPFHWGKHAEVKAPSGVGDGRVGGAEDGTPGCCLWTKTKKAPDALCADVQSALWRSLREFGGDVEEENDLESLIEQQLEALLKVFKVSHKASEARILVSKKLIALFRAGKLGLFVFDDVPLVGAAS